MYLKLLKNEPALTIAKKLLPVTGSRFVDERNLVEERATALVEGEAEQLSPGQYYVVVVFDDYSVRVIPYTVERPNAVVKVGF